MCPLPGKWKFLSVVVPASGNSVNPLKSCRAVTNFSSSRGIAKSSQGIKKVWLYSRRLLLREGGRGGGTVGVRV